MRQMFSKKQIEELSKLTIAGATNEEKQNFIPEIESIAVNDKQAIEGILDLSNEEYLYKRINLIVEENVGFSIKLPESIKAYILFDALAPDWACWNDNFVQMSGNDYLEEGEEGPILIIYTFRSIALVFIFDNY